jgi:hypothetical protein
MRLAAADGDRERHTRSICEEGLVAALQCADHLGGGHADNLSPT